MKLLVTGGAGYVGSFCSRHLLAQGHEIVVYDSLERGYAQAIAGLRLYRGDLADTTFLDDVFARENIEAVLHFASYIEAGVSVVDPAPFYHNNLTNGLNLLEAMRHHGVAKLIYSSSAGVYGEPLQAPIPEDAPKVPTNPYAQTKLVFERALSDYGAAYGLQSICLRYFNAAGADPEARFGEAHQPETHLIPLILQVALGQRPHIEVFGSDYPTPDGTAIRDYIHVLDLASAHALALQALERGRAPSPSTGTAGEGYSLAYNVGSGHGFSVAEVVKTCRRMTGHPIPAQEGPRRPGDPAALVADSSKIRRELGWEPHYSDLDRIVETAWRWHRSHPQGYGEG